MDILILIALFMLVGLLAAAVGGIFAIYGQKERGD